jgi:hypothetical protein
LREPYLKLDFDASVSLAPIYDADLENFWTQKSNLQFKGFTNGFLNLLILNLVKKENFIGQDDSKSDSKDNTNININIQNQKFQVISSVRNSGRFEISAKIILIIFLIFRKFQ